MDLTDSIKNSLSLAGVWQAVSDENITTLNNGEHTTTYGNIKLFKEKGESIVLSGWSFTGWSGANSITPINIALLVYQPDGTLKLETSEFIENTKTNGNWLPLIADFNQDGYEDIFLGAHNESPLMSSASTAYLSDENGGFTKVNLNDAVMMHQGSLAYVDGVPTVFGSTFEPGPYIYQYQTGIGFSVNKSNVDWDIGLGGDAGAAADFLGNGSLAFVGFDFLVASTGPYADIYVSELDNFIVQNPPKSILIPYFNSEEYSIYFGANSDKRVLEPRVNIDDFNNDGNLDIVAISGIWSPTSDWTMSNIQLFQNKKNYAFEDVTDILNSSFTLTSNPDYAFQMVDIDNSGIKTYLLGEGGTIDEKNGNYILLNDGTGKLHVALHDEFLFWGQQIRDFASENSLLSRYYIDTHTPNFRAYLNSDGTLNYAVDVSMWTTEGDSNTRRKALINFPAEYNAALDYKFPIVVEDRNQSQLIRTFAGDDVINDQNRSDQATNINGGFGSDSVIYSGLRSNYTVTQVSDGYSVQNKLASSASDLLVNIEKIQFVDKTTLIGDSIAGTAGQAYRIYRAAFDRDPMVDDAAGLGYWIAQMDAGMSMTEVAARFIDSAEFRSLYGATPTNGEFLTKVYNNVLDRDPDSDGYVWWMDQLANNPEKTWQKVLADFSESSENQANVASLIGNGITYDAWTG